MADRPRTITFSDGHRMEARGQGFAVSRAERPTEGPSPAETPGAGMAPPPARPASGTRDSVPIALEHVGLVAKKLPGVKEPPLPVFHNGVRMDDEVTPGADLFNVIEIFDQTADTSHFPLTWADLVGNTFVRPTYQKAGGPTASLGTSVVGSPSFRTSAGLQYIPSVVKADLSTGGADRIRSEVTALFCDPAANVVRICTFPDPAVGRTVTGLSVRFQCRQEITLDRALRGNDAFRLLTLSSMFSTSRAFDANVLRYEDPAGVVHTSRLGDATPRDVHLLSRGTELGSWFELVKEPGSTWFPDSPSIRVDIRDRRGVPGRLGIQGFLAKTQDENDDSLSVWVEWLDAPEVVPAGKSLGIDFLITATPPAQAAGD